MRRLFLLLLIALLPLQVFAGAADGAAAAVASVQQSIDRQDGGIEAIAKAAVASLQAALADAPGDQADQDADSNDNDVGNPHAGLDELAPLPVFAFAPQLFSLAPPTSSDAACAPPFIPPAARPPRA